LVDTFTNHFSFHLVNWKDTNAKIAHHNKLDSIYKDLLINQDIVLIILDTSVKNNIATLISHICREQKIITKTVYHAMNIMSTETKLFTVKYSINYGTQMQDIIHIIVITDAIPATKYIFDISIHLYQFVRVVNLGY